jgi:hypothetical protein
MRPMPFYVLAGGLDLLEIAFMLELPTYVGEGSQELGARNQGSRLECEHDSRCPQDSCKLASLLFVYLVWILNLPVSMD